ncbi:MAG: secretin N-terminal domain-containing protein [Francisellaceae bacterium]
MKTGRLYILILLLISTVAAASDRDNVSGLNCDVDEMIQFFLLPPATVKEPWRQWLIPDRCRWLQDPVAESAHYQITDIRLFRAINESAEIELQLNGINDKIEAFESPGMLKLILYNTDIAAHWQHHINVDDFNTIVHAIDINQRNDSVIFKIKMSHAFHYALRQEGRHVFITIVHAQSRIADFDNRKPISLIFNDASVADVFQVLAQFVGLNLMLSNAIDGRISLNLKNVPWQDALNIILISQKLGTRQFGGILYVAPLEEMADMESLLQQTEQLQRSTSTLETLDVHLNYASAKTIYESMKSDEHDLLQGRGSIYMDERTNTLIVTATKSVIEKVVRIIETVDVPLQQVLIETKIIEVSRDSALDLGIAAITAATASSFCLILSMQTVMLGDQQMPQFHSLVFLVA